MKASYGWGAWCSVVALCVAVSAGTVTTVAGGFIGDGRAATSASFAGPNSVLRDAQGNLYISDTYNCRIRKINAAGIVSTFAGTGICGYSGDGGPATSAMISDVFGMAFDRSGNILFADIENNRIRKITTAGVVTTIAGNGAFGYSGDGGPAMQASLASPVAISLDSAGNLYIADSANYVIRFVDTARNIHTVAGNHTSGFSGDGGPATSAQIGLTSSVLADQHGGFYIGDPYNQRVRRVDAAGTITSFANLTASGSLLLVDGSLYVSTSTTLETVSLSTRTVSLLAGDPNAAGFDGDGKPATAAKFDRLAGMAVDGAGNLFLVDSGNNRIRRIARSNKVVSTIAGGYIGDGKKANQASLNLFQGARPAFDGAGNLYISDGANNRVRKVSLTGTITTLAGTGTTGRSGDGGAATAANLNVPLAVAADNNGNVFIGDSGNGVIRKVDSSGQITTFSTFDVFSMAGITVDATGNVYVADGLELVYKVSPSGTTTVVAGVPGGIGYNGDGIPATQAWLYLPSGVAVDAVGNLYIADWANCRIRKVDTNGNITTVAGVGFPGFGGDGGPATSATLSYPMDVAVDAQGNLYIADWLNSRIRKVNPAGTIQTLAGAGKSHFNGDGLPASQTNLVPAGLAMRNGEVYFSDELSFRVRKVH